MLFGSTRSPFCSVSVRGGVGSELRLHRLGLISLRFVIGSVLSRIGSARVRSRFGSVSVRVGLGSVSVRFGLGSVRSRVGSALSRSRFGSVSVLVGRDAVSVRFGRQVKPRLNELVGFRVLTFHSDGIRATLWKLNCNSPTCGRPEPKANRFETEAKGVNHRLSSG